MIPWEQFCLHFCLHHGNLFIRLQKLSSIQVLRLWLERKIFPQSVLRRYMDDIGVSNDDTTAGFSLRRPSRAERAIDDPIREMEGMFVDEYGRYLIYLAFFFFI